jgi:pimeloyl-ACP methyl ester carboxylesterase
MKPNSILRIFCLVLLLLTSACANIADLAQGFLYPTESANQVAVPSQPPAGFAQELLNVSHPNGNLKIHVWYRRDLMSSNAPVVIHFHGNGENLGRLANGDFLEKTATFESHFVVFDYPGYGNSTGFPEQSTLLAAAQATVAWTKRTFPTSPLILWGWSLGSAVAFQTASLNAGIVRALIADSAWTNIRELAKEKFGPLATQIPEELFKKNEWNSLAVAPTVDVPLLMRHGSEDDLIPLTFGQRVSEAAKPQLVRFRIETGKGHGDVFTGASYWPELASLIKSVR